MYHSIGSFILISAPNLFGNLSHKKMVLLCFVTLYITILKQNSASKAPTPSQRPLDKDLIYIYI